MICHEREAAKPLRVPLPEGLALQRELRATSLPPQQRRVFPRRQPKVPVQAIDHEHRVVGDRHVVAGRGGFLGCVACEQPVAPASRWLAHSVCEVAEVLANCFVRAGFCGAKRLAGVQRVAALGRLLQRPRGMLMHHAAGVRHAVRLLLVLVRHAGKGEAHALDPHVLDEHHGLFLLLTERGEVRARGGWDVPLAGPYSHGLVVIGAQVRLLEVAFKVGPRFIYDRLTCVVADVRVFVALAKQRERAARAVELERLGPAQVLHARRVVDVENPDRDSAHFDRHVPESDHSGLVCDLCGEAHLGLHPSARAQVDLQQVVRECAVRLAAVVEVAHLLELLRIVALRLRPRWRVIRNVLQGHVELKVALPCDSNILECLASFALRKRVHLADGALVLLVVFVVRVEAQLNLRRRKRAVP